MPFYDVLYTSAAEAVIVAVLRQPHRMSAASVFSSIAYLGVAVRPSSLARSRVRFTVRRTHLSSVNEALSAGGAVIESQMSRAPAIRFHAAKSKAAAASRNAALPGLEDKSRPRERRSHVRGAVHGGKKVTRSGDFCTSCEVRALRCVLGEPAVC